MKKLLLVSASVVAIAAVPLSAFASSPAEEAIPSSPLDAKVVTKSGVKKDGVSSEKSSWGISNGGGLFWGNADATNDMVAFISMKSSTIKMSDNNDGKKQLVVDMNDADSNASVVLLNGSPVVSADLIKARGLDEKLEGYFAHASSAWNAWKVAKVSGRRRISLTADEQRDFKAVTAAQRGRLSSEPSIPAALLSWTAAGKQSAVPALLTGVKAIKGGETEYTFSFSDATKVPIKTLKALSELSAPKDVQVILSLEADRNAALADSVRKIRFTSVSFLQFAKK